MVCIGWAPARRLPASSPGWGRWPAWALGSQALQPPPTNIHTHFVSATIIPPSYSYRLQDKGIVLALLLRLSRLMVHSIEIMTLVWSKQNRTEICMIFRNNVMVLWFDSVFAKGTEVGAPQFVPIKCFYYQVWYPFGVPRTGSIHAGTKSGLWLPFHEALIRSRQANQKSKALSLSLRWLFPLPRLPKNQRLLRHWTMKYTTANTDHRLIINEPLVIVIYACLQAHAPKRMAITKLHSSMTGAMAT